jgi:hypothetical protein
MFAASAIGAALLWVGSAGAQEKKAEGSTVNVTGCLAQGDEKNEYSIKDADGKTYGLKAGSELNLKAHLGHKLTITGRSDRGKERKGEGRKSRGE